MSLFADLVAQRRGVLADVYSMHSAYTMLCDAGLINEEGVVSSIVCDDCNIPHDAEIAFKNQRYGYFCPELGFIERDRASLIAAQPNVAAFVAQLADDLECKRRKPTPIAGDFWRVGAIEAPEGNIVIYFKPTLRSGQDLRDLECALMLEVRAPVGIILTADGTLSKPPFNTITFEDSLGYDQTLNAFIVDADLWAVAGIPVVRKGGRPNEFEKLVTNLILERKKAGLSPLGRNQDAKAVLVDYTAQHPDKEPPSLATIKRYVSKVRSGS